MRCFWITLILIICLTCSLLTGRVNADTTVAPVYSCSDPSYLYSSTPGRCEKAPACPAGATYDSATDICRGTTTYTATVNSYSCPSGGVLSGTTCGSYPAVYTDPTVTCHDALAQWIDYDSSCFNSDSGTTVTMISSNVYKCTIGNLCDADPWFTGNVYSC